jgi:outer membrane protein assembly factor BamE (lipoprotein component of BamABCDE complex)
MKRFFLPLLCFLSFSACYYTLQSTQGARISSAQIQEIKLGKTTEADLLKLLGPPSKREKTLSGNEQLTYLQTRTESLTFIGGYVAKGVLDREQQEGFEITLKNGIVQSYRYLKPE